VLLVYIILGDEYPRVQHEFGPLVASLLVFFFMTTLSAASFYALLTKHKTVLLLQIAMWVGLAATTFYFLP
jgi:hypothetical protein